MADEPITVVLRQLSPRQDMWCHVSHMTWVMWCHVAEMFSKAHSGRDGSPLAPHLARPLCWVTAKMRNMTRKKVSHDCLQIYKRFRVYYYKKSSKIAKQMLNRKETEMLCMQFIHDHLDNRLDSVNFYVLFQISFENMIYVTPTLRIVFVNRHSGEHWTDGVGFGTRNRSRQRSWWQEEETWWECLFSCRDWRKCKTMNLVIVQV